MSHMYKNMEPKEFLEAVLKYDMVGNLWNNHKYYQALFVLAYFDYISETLSLGLFVDYNVYREYKLEELAIPSGIMLKYKFGDDNAINDAIEECKNDPLGKYFYQFNILYKEE